MDLRSGISQMVSCYIVDIEYNQSFNYLTLAFDRIP